MAEKRKLTIKQKKFVNEIVKTGNGAESVVRAGYDVKDRNVAKSIASENLTKPDVKQAIEEKFKLEDITVEEIVRRIDKESKNAPNASDRLRANELLGKFRGIFREIQQMNNVFQTFNIEDQSIITKALEHKDLDNNSDLTNNQIDNK